MTGLIKVKLTELNQLFNSMDPSPFHERDLNRGAEEFIVSWAQEHPRHCPLKLVVHLARCPADVKDAQKIVTDSVHNYFAYRASMSLRELKRLLREGRTALLVGVVFLGTCQLAANLLPHATYGWQMMVREGLTIIGWVAMWKPLDIYLYRWWPLVALLQLHRRLGRMSVEVQCESPT